MLGNYFLEKQDQINIYKKEKTFICTLFPVCCLAVTESWFDFGYSFLEHSLLIYSSGISFKTYQNAIVSTVGYSFQILFCFIGFQTPYFILYLRVQHINRYYTTSRHFINREFRKLFISYTFELFFFLNFLKNNFYLIMHQQS